MFAKNPVKCFSVLLSFLAVIALGSLLAQLVETNHNYASSLAHVRYLQSHLGETHERLLQLSEEQLAGQERSRRLDLLEFKSATFQKKFPDFSRIVEIAFQKARCYGFNPNLVLSVIQVESAFNPLAVSRAGAYGLMQVHYAVWKEELGIDKGRIFEIAYNIDLGMRILKQLHDISGGNIQRTLFLYNNGYKYNNTGYIGKVTSSIYNQEEPAGSSLAGVSH